MKKDNDVYKREFRELTEDQKIEVRSLSKQGEKLTKEGRYEEALACFEKALEIDPKNAEAWNCKGKSMDRLSRHQEAEQCFDKAIEINPSDARYWNNKGISVEMQQRYEEAMQYYNKAIELDPNFVKAWRNKGAYLEESGSLEEAIDCFGRALKIDPCYELAIEDRERCRHKIVYLEEVELPSISAELLEDVREERMREQRNNGPQIFVMTNGTTLLGFLEGISEDKRMVRICGFATYWAPAIRILTYETIVERIAYVWELWPSVEEDREQFELYSVNPDEMGYHSEAFHLGTLEDWKQRVSKSKEIRREVLDWLTVEGWWPYSFYDACNERLARLCDNYLLKLAQGNRSYGSLGDGPASRFGKIVLHDSTLLYCNWGVIRHKVQPHELLPVIKSNENTLAQTSIYRLDDLFVKIAGTFTGTTITDSLKPRIFHKKNAQNLRLKGFLSRISSSVSGVEGDERIWGCLTEHQIARSESLNRLEWMPVSLRFRDFVFPEKTVERIVTPFYICGEFIPETIDTPFGRKGGYLRCILAFYSE